MFTRSRCSEPLRIHEIDDGRTWTLPGLDLFGSAMSLDLMRECVFCSDACETMDAYEEMTTPSPSYVLARLEGLRILSDNAPVAPGHVLIVPDVHVRSAALLGAEQLARLDDLLARLCRGLAEIFDSPVVVFEHGTGGERQKYACCLDHVHLHAVPTTADVGRWFENEPSLLEVEELADLTLLADQEYLFARRHGERGRAWAAEGQASQVFRRLIADHEGVLLWNWQDRILLGQADARAHEIRAAVIAATPAMHYLGTRP